ncbi:pleckstrin homology domain-containing family M member 2-like isoform X1 [Anguilla rostrata]|uniref:pleckstrin homology domain-containing family M member 2-like isoform X1 n=1 Tax=Anguilla rostrata TaxID=7938 RepID=UPI0030CAED77
MDQLKVKDRILENLSLSVKKLQSYFAACEDETPAIRNHDRVLQRLCEHLDHALLYGLQNISSGYWVLVLHFTRREAIRQIEGLQQIATNLGRSRAWLYLALSESSLESYLRLFQENQALLQKYYYENALVCSHDHLTLFLTLVSGLEFIRFDLELDAPYLDVTPYMPEYYKPQNLLDFEERLPGVDSLSLHSFTSTNLEWDDSAIAPSSEDYDFGDLFPVLQSLPSADWEEGDLTDPVPCPCSIAPESPPVIATVMGTGAAGAFTKDSGACTYADVTPTQRTSWPDCSNGDDTESTELEVIRVARRRKPGKRRRGKGVSECVERAHEEAPGGCCAGEGPVSSGGPHEEGTGPVRARDEEAEEDVEGLLRLPEMTDTSSMEGVGELLSEVVNSLDRDGRGWEGEAGGGRGTKGGSSAGAGAGPLCPQQQPFRGDPEGEPPATPSPLSRPTAQDPTFLQVPPAPADFYRFTPHSPGSAVPCDEHDDPAEPGQSEALPGCHDDEAEKPVGPDSAPALVEEGEEACPEREENGHRTDEESQEVKEEEPPGPADSSHPAEIQVDNNHLLLLMLHVFRESEEQLCKMVSMSTGHMEGNLQALYVLLTDSCVYLLRRGSVEKPYNVEDSLSYSELDSISVGLDQQTVRLVCADRSRQVLLDTADVSLTVWFLDALNSAMAGGRGEPPRPPVLTDATMERLALTKFVCQEAHCQVSEVCIRLYSLVHWEDPMDVTVGSPVNGPLASSSTKEGPLFYRAGTSYLGRGHWKRCYLVLSNGILYQYPERTDVKPLLSISLGGEHCGGCRRSGSSERRNAFQVVLPKRPPLELSADSEGDMAEWMQLLCQAACRGMIPQGAGPSPCIPCCLVLTDRQLLTCHQDCQTSFFRSLGTAELRDITAVCLETDAAYCVIEFSEERAQFLPPWVLYFSGCEERDRLLGALQSAWRDVFQLTLPQKGVSDPAVQTRCREALALIRSGWQHGDSLHPGTAPREPWC